MASDKTIKAYNTLDVVAWRVCQNMFLLSKCNVILNVSEGSQYKYARFFLPNGRQNL